MGRRGHAAKRKVVFVDTDESPEKNSFPEGEESTDDEVPEEPTD